MMDELVALYIAYTILWAGLFGYMGYMHMVQSKLAKELKLLQDLVKKNE
jgi:CcmD family protein